jgi:hypothetical protein
MKSYSKNELEEALFAIVSTIKKCEKSLLKFSENSPQKTLLIRRIKAFKISQDLIEKNISYFMTVQNEETTNR